MAEGSKLLTRGLHGDYMQGPNCKWFLTMAHLTADMERFRTSS